MASTATALRDLDGPALILARPRCPTSGLGVPHASTQNRANVVHSGPVGQVDMRRSIQDHQIRRRSDGHPTDIGTAQAAAPPAVAARRASAGVIRISRTANATQNGIEEVNDEPGLQSVASATVTPAPSSRQASG